jgi:hypothetical protein
MLINRYGYKNTNSSAGRGQRHDINTEDIAYIMKWNNYYGNPSYVFHMNNGDTYYLVDDYGAMNDIREVTAHSVARKKDMF